VTFVEIFNPVAFLLILFLLQKLYEGEQISLTVEQSFAGNLPKCIIGPNRDSCFTLLYAPASDSLTTDLISHLALSNDPPLTIGKLQLQNNNTQINSTAVASLPDIGGLDTQTELEQFILNNPNTTQNAVYFFIGPTVY